MRRVIIALMLVMVSASSAGADPAYPCEPDAPCHLRMRDPSTLLTYNGDTLRLPPGRFIDEPTFDMIDTELQRLQDQETRLKAENKSFRDSLDGWKPGWVTITLATLSGIATGISTYYYWTHR